MANDKNYLVTKQMVTLAGIGSLVLGTLILAVLLWRASSQPQGRYTNVNTSQYQRTVTGAAQDLANTAADSPNTDSGRYQIPIDQAINIVANQGIAATSQQLASGGSATSNLIAESAPWSLRAATAVAVTPGKTPATTASQMAAAPEPATPAADAPASGDGADMQAAAPASGPSNAEIMASLPGGENIFNANCASCHQANGQGVTGAFPALAGHVPSLYNADRDYLPNLLLYGLQGQINVAGVGYNGVMPAWAQLSDEDLAAVLNYISTAWGNESDLQNFQAYQPDDVASKRSNGYSAIQIHDELRANLNLQ
jgi:mono/diheme cytochrome c family protein